MTQVRGAVAMRTLSYHLSADRGADTCAKS